MIDPLRTYTMCIFILLYSIHISYQHDYYRFFLNIRDLVGPDTVYAVHVKKHEVNTTCMQVALAACALPIRQPRQPLKVKHVRPDLELMILMRHQGFRCI